MNDPTQTEIDELKLLVNAMDKQIGRQLGVISVQRSALDLASQVQSLIEFDLEELCVLVLADRFEIARNHAVAVLRKLKKPELRPSKDGQQTIPFPKEELSFPPEPGIDIPTPSETGLPLRSTSTYLDPAQKDSMSENSPTSP